MEVEKINTFAKLKKKEEKKNSRTQLVGMVRDPRVASVHQFHRQLAHLVPFPKTFYLAFGFFLWKLLKSKQLPLIRSGASSPR